MGTAVVDGEAMREVLDGVVGPMRFLPASKEIFTGGRTPDTQLLPQSGPPMTKPTEWRSQAWR